MIKKLIFSRGNRNIQTHTLYINRIILYMLVYNVMLFTQYFVSIFLYQHSYISLFNGCSSLYIE